LQKGKFREKKKKKRRWGHPGRGPPGNSTVLENNLGLPGGATVRARHRVAKQRLKKGELTQEVPGTGSIHTCRERHPDNVPKNKCWIEGTKPGVVRERKK